MALSGHNELTQQEIADLLLNRERRIEALEAELAQWQARAPYLDGDHVTKGEYDEARDQVAMLVEACKHPKGGCRICGLIWSGGDRQHQDNCPLSDLTATAQAWRAQVEREALLTLLAAADEDAEDDMHVYDWLNCAGRSALAQATPEVQDSTQTEEVDKL